MPTPIPCISNCVLPQLVNIPGIDGLNGAPGTPGAAGANGVNAYSITAAPFTIPADGSNTASIAFTSANNWMVVGQSVVIGQGATLLAFPGPAHFKVFSVDAVNSQAILTKLPAAGDAAQGQQISLGAIVSPAGAPGPTGATGSSGAIKLLGSGMNLNFTNTNSNFLTITEFPSSYVVTQILVYGSTGSLAGAKGGIFGNTLQVAPVIVSANQLYAAVNAAGVWLSLPLAAAALSGQQALTNPIMYLYLTVASLGAFTANIAVYGYDLS